MIKSRPVLVIAAICIAILYIGITGIIGYRKHHLSSRSVEESKEMGVFKGFLLLIPKDKCLLTEEDYLFWYESAWKPRYFLVWQIGVKKIGYNNYFFKNKYGEDMDIVMLNKRNYDHVNRSYSIEPPLGYHFFLDEDIKIEEIEIEKNFNARKCKYHVILKK